MDLEPSDPAFQRTTQARLAEYPLAFFAKREDKGQQPFNKNGSNPIPYHRLLTNVGEAMTTEGAFTAPMSGVYFFVFNFVEWSAQVETEVQLRLNGKAISSGMAFDGYVSNGDFDHIPASVQMTIELTRGDNVDSYLASGTLTSSSVNFSGFLVYPLPTV
jgi:hypothetical protein